MNIEKYIQQITELEDAESPEGRTNRFGLMMDTILENTEGDVYEIGCGYGHSTAQFLKAAKKFGRSVVAIDPFNDGVYPYKDFLKRVKGFDNLFLTKDSSQDLSGLTRQAAFAFIDGLQTKEAVLHDLNLCSNAKIICVDDINRETPTSQVPAAVEEFLKLGTYRMVKTRKLIECYLIKND